MTPEDFDLYHRGILVGILWRALPPHEQTPEDREHGPLYSASEWFSEGKPMPSLYRTRFRRAVERLAKLGLVTVYSPDGRTTRLKLTAEGEKVTAPIEAEVRETGVLGEEW